MNISKHLGILVLLGAAFVYGAFSCSEEPLPSGGDGDADGDSDTDADADADTDADGDADSDSDSDADVQGISVMPGDTGWIEDQDNTLGIQGAWYTFGCPGASLTPAEGAQFNRTAQGMCFQGTAPQVTDEDGDGEPDWSTIWGAGMGFDVCATGADEIPAETKYTLGTCPFNSNLANMVTGVQVDFTGTVNAGTDGLRIQFNEGDNVTNAYVTIPTTDIPGTATALFTDASVGYDPSKKPEGTVKANVKAIQFQIPANGSSAVDWNFCVTDVRMQTP